MEATPEAAQGWVDFFQNNGFMVLLAITGFVLPPAMLFGGYLLIRLFINKLADPLRRLADFCEAKDGKV